MEPLLLLLLQGFFCLMQATLLFLHLFLFHLLLQERRNKTRGKRLVTSNANGLHDVIQGFVFCLPYSLQFQASASAAWIGQICCTISTCFFIKIAVIHCRSLFLPVKRWENEGAESCSLLSRVAQREGGRARWGLIHRCRKLGTYFTSPWCLQANLLEEDSHNFLGNSPILCTRGWKSSRGKWLAKCTQRIACLCLTQEYTHSALTS